MEEVALTQATPVRILRSDPRVAVAEFASLCIVVWRGHVTRESFQLQSSGLAEVVRRNPRRTGFLVVIEKTAKPPDEELRRASVRMVESHGANLASVAVVIEGQGFRAALNRGVITGMVLLARELKPPVSILATPFEAARWMRAQSALPRADDIAAAVEYVRGQLAERL